MAEAINFDVDPNLGMFAKTDFDLGVILEAEKVTDEEHALYDEGTTYTGYYAIRLVTQVGVLTHVGALWPSISGGAQSGTIYHPGTIVLLVRITARKIPIILGAFPASYLSLKKKGDINVKQINPVESRTELEEGEQMLQSAVKDEVDASDQDLKDLGLIRFKGGFIKLDKLGGFQVMTRQDGDLLITHGDRDKEDAKLTWIKVSGRRDENATVEISHSSGTNVKIVPDGSIEIENVKKKTEHTVDLHTQNDDSDLMITVKGKTVLRCDDIQLADDDGERSLMGETFARRFDNHTHLGNLGRPTGTPVTTATNHKDEDLSDHVHHHK